ncbi:MAG: hypothetical protein AAF704_18995 [Cyanobacteria bacterium P01_D01_bin.123]
MASQLTAAINSRFVLVSAKMAGTFVRSTKVTSSAMRPAIGSFLIVQRLVLLGNVITHAVLPDI